ncbi:MAG: TonB-dependent receptor plug domain-containing protein [Muribaculaceae bacterium]|nr:TonB-dependent receptor plug domain-containing protein [Muribaculaceae bacterium]
MNQSLIYIISILILLAGFRPAQASASVNFTVCDAESHAPLEFAAISLAMVEGDKTIGGDTDVNGHFSALVSAGKWRIDVRLVGYKPWRQIMSLGDGMSYSIALLPNEPLDEVVVTARESHSASSASLIDTTAMQHLQPSSFTDLLELLPGQVSKDPAMGAPNVINLRTALNVTPTDDYMTSAIGTSFIVDGVPINNNAVMQTTPDSNHSDRETVGKGVDMRGIATDDIEKVEIVRGIASVEYGELTSGLVNIKRKSGVSRLEARFKADSKSQLFYIGKGFRMPGEDWIVNAGIGYLDAKIDPRNSRENYKRITASLRSNKRFDNDLINVMWNSSLNYSASFERDNNDPDLTVNNTIDRFSTDNHNFSWNNSVTFRPVERSFFQEASFTSGLSYNRERLHQTRHVAQSRVMPMPVSLIPGSNYVGYLPMLYLATLDVEGDPFTAFVKGATSLNWTSGILSSFMKAGVEWNMSKNYGRGNVYDIERPITASISSRPRAFSDIPAMHQLSTYIESRNIMRLGRQTLECVIGLRETQLLHLDSRYKLSGRPYLDPRASLTWIMPAWYIDEQPIVPELNAGIGLQSKMPVAAFLYPDLVYTDFEQLNYYHNMPDYRVMNVMTYVEDMTNYELKAARNLKWEIRGDLSYRDNRLSLTYFRETMNNGFRHAGNVHFYNYRRYDASGYNPELENRAPKLEDLPSTEMRYMAVRSTVTNGSSTRKEGLEYTFQSRRIKAIKTRVTVSGAYMKTINTNSDPLWYKPGIVMNGQELPFIGLYDDADGSIYKSFNTNVMFDTDIPTLGLRFSLGFQTVWFTSRQTHFKTGIPTHYMDIDGNIFEFTKESEKDTFLQQLVREYSSTAFEKNTVPAETAINLKATKSFWKNRVNVALYVNRLFTIAPDYKPYGVVVRRYYSPYFGMELNFKI